MRTGIYAAALAATAGLLALPFVAAVGTMTPEEANLKRENLEEISRKLRMQISTGQLPGAAFQVYRGGKLVWEDAVGYQDRELMRPMSMNTIVRLMSQTKPLVAAGIMILIERGQLSVDDPLYKYHPKFRHMTVATWDEQGGTVPSVRDITIKDLLCHTAGFGYSGGFNDPNGDGIMSTLQVPFQSLDAFVDDLADKPLLWQPGSGWRYSWSYDVLGYVIKKITRQSPDDWLRQNLFTPLKMYDTDFYVPVAKIDRFAVAYTMTPGNRLIPIIRPRMDPLQAFRPPTFLSCGSGIVSTLHDYSRFALMLLNGGDIDGVRILKSETVDEMWRNQLDLSLLPMDLNGWKSDMNTGWGYGFTVSAPGPLPQVNWTEHRGSKRTGTIGWGGGMMTNWIASADNDILVMFATQRLATPIPNTFQEIVVQGVMDSIAADSPRKLPGPEGPGGNAADFENDVNGGQGGWRGNGGRRGGMGGGAGGGRAEVGLPPLARIPTNPMQVFWPGQWLEEETAMLEALNREQAKWTETQAQEAGAKNGNLRAA